MSFYTFQFFFYTAVHASDAKAFIKVFYEFHLQCYQMHFLNAVLVL